MRVKLHKFPSVVIACFILHNISKYLQNDLPADDIVEENNDYDNTQNEHVQDVQQRRAGQE
ncbi:hypothetical protein NQ314_016195 [Rhamnusium bicolor]|uniref:Uncharacterized protein n=1 Tax=Rhamnusium bicolor TaxID=1586634 RepID=A0AAV8WXJ5_9CUCU|nr:hypothetical protein NQ314_016195 [Rhamnusium bicolor]